MVDVADRIVDDADMWADIVIRRPMLKEWDESLYERDELGRFTSNGGGGSAENADLITGNKDVASTLSQVYKNGVKSADIVSLRYGGRVPDLSPEEMEAKAEETMAYIQNRWANGTPEDSEYFRGMQLSAIQQFGLQNYAELPPPMGGVGQLVDRGANAIADNPAMGAILQAQYNDTQELLASKDLQSVTLYRALLVPEGEPVASPGDMATMRPLSSWSVDKDYVTGFSAYLTATDDKPGNKSVIISAQIPASQIQSVPSTGFGVATEYEAIVLGGPVKIESAELGQQLPYNPLLREWMNPDEYGDE